MRSPNARRVGMPTDRANDANSVEYSVHLPVLRLSTWGPLRVSMMSAPSTYSFTHVLNA